jgi:hypothetical protein
MAEPTRCHQCGTPLAAHVNYCPDCGAPHSVPLFDPLDVEGRTSQRPGTQGSERRNAFFVTLTIVAAVVVGIWLLGRSSDRPVEDASSDGTDPVDEIPSTTTTPVTTTSITTTTAAPTTTRPASDTTELTYINESPGPVLGPDIDGYVVELVGRSMRRLDLSTGAFIEVELGTQVVFNDPMRERVLIDDRMVTVFASQLVLTDVATGHQVLRQLDFGDTEEVIGQAGPSSVWVTRFDGSGTQVVEIGLDGGSGRIVDVPEPFYPRSAHGDELWLDSIDGLWSYDTGAGEATRMPGQVISHSRDPLIMIECGSDLACRLTVDHGDGPTRLADLEADQVWFWSINQSPDGDRVLIPTGAGDGWQFTLIHLDTGETVDLGTLPVEPFFGVAWVDRSPWIVARHQIEPRRWLAINTATGETVDLNVPPSSRDPFESTHLYVPA